MNLKNEDVRPYVGNRIALDILLLLATKSLPISKIVESMDVEREDVLTWIKEMDDKGFISVELKQPRSPAEAQVSLKKDARRAIQRLWKPFLSD